MNVLLDDGQRLLFRTAAGPVAIDVRSRTVQVNRNPQTRLDEYRQVQLMHRLTSDEGGDLWFVRLAGDSVQPVVLGTTTDETEASVAGARVGTVLGLPIVVVK